MTSDGIPTAKGAPQFLGAGAPATAADSNAISQWASDNIDASVPTYADLALLPVVWPGMRRFVIADNGEYVRTSAGWVKASLVDDTGWIAPALLASWLNYGAPYRASGYRRLNGVVYGTGLIKNGTATAGTVVMVLPVGCRPSALIVLVVESSNVFCLVSVDASGNVALVTPAAVGGSLSLQFSFLAEA